MAKNPHLIAITILDFGLGRVLPRVGGLCHPSYATIKSINETKKGAVS